jgi:molecular chaperone HscC
LAFCGIDLGTTNSLIAVIEEGTPKLIPNALGQVLTPSCVGIGDTGAVLVGQAAKERLITHPRMTAASFKRLMGSKEESVLGKSSYRPEELSQFVLRSLKEDAEAYLKESVSDVVISVPAYFSDHQRKATIDAGRLAGLKVERLVNEPTAAALAYGLGDATEGKYLIFDLGGGTFDVSILDKYEGVMEIRATTGDSGLGGDDFTGIIERMIAALGKLDLNQLDLIDQARVRRAAELLKINLSSSHEAPFVLSIGKQKYEGTITRQAFETECSGLLRRLRAPTERALVDARLKPDSFDSIVLVGGSTRLPMVRSLVARMFGRLPLVSVDPDTTVALGAAVQAGLAKRDGAFKDVVMTDVCPFTLGVVATDASNPKQMTNYVRAVIERNAVIPISRKMRLHTLDDNQTTLPVRVFQGENLRPEANIHIGTIPLTVPPKPKGRNASTSSSPTTSAVRSRLKWKCFQRVSKTARSFATCPAFPKRNSTSASRHWRRSSCTRANISRMRRCSLAPKGFMRSRRRRIARCSGSGSNNSKPRYPINACVNRHRCARHSANGSIPWRIPCSPTSRAEDDRLSLV